MAKKQLLDRKKLLLRIKDANEIGLFKDSEAAFLKYVTEKFEELERDALRYRTYRKMMYGAGKIFTEKDAEDLERMLDKEMRK